MKILFIILKKVVFENTKNKNIIFPSNKFFMFFIFNNKKE